MDNDKRYLIVSSTNHRIESIPSYPHKGGQYWMGPFSKHLGKLMDWSLEIAKCALISTHVILLPNEITDTDIVNTKRKRCRYR